MSDTKLEIGKFQLSGWKATIGVIVVFALLNLPSFLLGYVVGSMP